MVLTTRSKNRLYKVTLLVEHIQCLLIQATTDSFKWHARLGHVNIEKMKTMINKELVTGIPTIVINKETCVSCLLVKKTRQPFPKEISYRAIRPLKLIHGDLCGPITPPTPARKRYVFVIIDDFSHYMWIILLQEKSEAFEEFLKFKILVEEETKATIQTFWVDRGGEFISHEFQAYGDKQGIRRHLTAPYSPQQTGVVERRNQTLLEMTRSILKHLSVPNYLWGEAVRHCTYLINRVTTRSLLGKTPYEAPHERKPNLEHLRVFGCVSYVRTEAAGRRKLCTVKSVGTSWY